MVTEEHSIRGILAEEDVRRMLAADQQRSLVKHGRTRAIPLPVLVWSELIGRRLSGAGGGAGFRVERDSLSRVSAGSVLYKNLRV